MATTASAVRRRAELCERGGVPGEHDVREPEERARRGQRLQLEDVEAGAADRAVAQRVDERGLVDQAAARGVHDHGVRG